MTSIVFGATGLCGKEILKHADKQPNLTKLVSVTRRPFDFESEKLTKRVESDVDKYGEIINEVKPKICFSGLGTTRAAAGSAKAFVDIDYGINYKIAKAAKEAGVETFVLISSIGANAHSPFLYMKTKGRLEDDVIALKFPRTIILRPGPLLGEREKSKGMLDKMNVFVNKFFHGTIIGRWTLCPIYGSEVGKAAVQLALEKFSTAEGPVVEIVGGKGLLDVASSN